MKVTKKILLIVGVLLILIAPHNASAHGGDHHIRDMWEVFPFERNSAKDAQIQELFRAVTDYLDKPNDLNTGRPNFINQDESLNKLELGTHRIWYHWGFNVDVRKYEPLRRKIDENIQKGRITKDDETLFWLKLNNDISKRNRKVMNLATKLLYNLPLDDVSVGMRQRANGFVTILYNVHLKGDQQTTDTEYLPNNDVIYNTVCDAIDKIAGKTHSDIEKATALKNKLRLVKNKDIEFLDKLKEEFTPFLLSLTGYMSNYKQSLPREGFILKKQPSKLINLFNP